MALTPPGDLYLGLNDSIFPKVFAAIVSQRPSLLNYATSYFASNPQTWCQPIASPTGTPPVTVVSPLQLTTDNSVPSVDLLIQITNIAAGFGKDTVGLPPSMQPLPPQRIALKISFAARFSIPKLDPSTIGCPDNNPFSKASFPPHLCSCFTGDLFLTAAGDIMQCDSNMWITFALDQFDSTNITPAGLQETANYFLALLVDTKLLPQMWFNVAPAVIDLSKTLPASAPIKTITVTPSAPAGSPNPNIASDLLEARSILTVTTP